jgi:hypothetical protein
MAYNEHIERLEAMTQDDGETWDLSDNDKAAIRYALQQLAEARKGAFLDAVTHANAMLSGFRSAATESAESGSLELFRNWLIKESEK